MLHPISISVLSTPSTRSPTQPPSTPITHRCIFPAPRPTANTRNKYNIHQHVCIADVWTPPHFTPLQPQLHSTSLYSSAVPFHGVSSVQLNPTHHCMRADMQCRQSDASRQAGGRASRQATINAHILARMQGGKAGSRQADKEASRRTCRKAGKQACKHVVFWVFVFFIATKLTFIQIQPWELRIPGDPGTKEPGGPRPSKLGVYMYIYIYTFIC